MALIYGVAVQYCHPWTYLQYCGGLTVLLAYMVFKALRKRDYSESLILFTFLVITAVLYLANGYIFSDIDVLNATSKLEQNHLRFYDFWESNKLTFFNLYGGIHSETALLLLSVVGALKLDKKNNFYCFLLALLVASSPIYFRGHVTFDTDEAVNLIPSRILYNIPAVIMAAVFLVEFDKYDFPPKLFKDVVKLFIFSSSAVYLLRSLQAISMS